MRGKTNHSLQNVNQKNDEEWIWGNSRGGGGDPVRSATGAPISKLGTILHAIDHPHEQRPSTSLHLPNHRKMNHHHLFESGSHPTTPSTSLSVSQIFEPIQTHSSHSTPPLPSHQSPPIIKSMELEHTPIHTRHISVESHSKIRDHSMRASSSVSFDNGSLVEEGIIPTELSVTLDSNKVYLELKSIKQLLSKQLLFDSIRWGLSNLHLIDPQVCIGTLAGTNTAPITLPDLLRQILFEFLKFRSYNIGNRMFQKGRPGEAGESEFREKLSESLLLLTGAIPVMKRRTNGDYDVFNGDYTQSNEG
jgi:hypothetical protein